MPISVMIQSVMIHGIRAKHFSPRRFLQPWQVKIDDIEDGLQRFHIIDYNSCSIIRMSILSLVEKRNCNEINIAIAVYFERLKSCTQLKMNKRKKITPFIVKYFFYFSQYNFPNL